MTTPISCSEFGFISFNFIFKKKLFFFARLLLCCSFHVTQTNLIAILPLKTTITHTQRETRTLGMCFFSVRLQINIHFKKKNYTVWIFGQRIFYLIRYILMRMRWKLWQKHSWSKRNAFTWSISTTDCTWRLHTHILQTISSETRCCVVFFFLLLLSFASFFSLCPLINIYIYTWNYWERISLVYNNKLTKCVSPNIYIYIYI